MGATARGRREAHKEINLHIYIYICSPQKSNSATMLWNMSEATGRDDECFDLASEQNIDRRNAVRQELRTKRLQIPVLALTASLRKVEEWEEAGSSTARGSRSRKWRDLLVAKSRLLCVHFLLTGKLAHQGRAHRCYFTLASIKGGLQQ